MGEVVAIVNQKGGVGKTTVTLGLASAAMARGHRCLVVDLDPQGASTWVLGIDPSSLDRTMADVMSAGRSGAGAGAVVHSEWSHLVDVLPSSPDLQTLEVLRTGLDGLLSGARPQTRLRRGLRGVSEGYGLVLIDCPPSLGSLTANGLAAATNALIVVEPTALGLRGVEPVADLIDDVWHHHNQWLDVAGVILNRVPARSHDAEIRARELSRSVGARSVWTPSIPHRVVLAEAAADRRAIHQTGARGRAVAEIFDALYARLWRKIRPRRS